MSLSYRNQSIDLLRESMDWFLYVRDLRHERFKENFSYRKSSYFFCLQIFFVEYFRGFLVSIFVVFPGVVFHLMWCSFQI